MKITRHPARLVAVAFLVLGVVSLTLASTPVRVWAAEELAEAGYHGASLTLLQSALRREAVTALGYEVDPDTELLEDERTHVSPTVLELKRRLLESLRTAARDAAEDAEEALAAGDAERAADVSRKALGWLEQAATLRRTIGGDDPRVTRATLLRLLTVRVKVQIGEGEWERAAELVAEAPGIPVLELGSPDAYVRLAEELAAVGRWERAGQVAFEGVRLRGERPRLMYFEMLGRVAAGDRVEARAIGGRLLAAEGYREGAPLGAEEADALLSSALDLYRREMELRAGFFRFATAHVLVGAYEELGLGWDRERLVAAALERKPEVADVGAVERGIEGFTVLPAVHGASEAYDVQVYWHRPAPGGGADFDIIERTEEGVWVRVGDRLCFEARLPNRVVNGDFEASEPGVGFSPGWRSRVFDLTDLRGFRIVDAARPGGGARALEITNVYDADTGLRSNPFPTAPDSLVLAGVDYRAQGGKAYVALRFMGADPGVEEPEATIESLVQQEYLVAIGSAEAWTRQQGLFAVPPGASWVRFWLFNMGPGTRAWFDNLYAVSVPPPPIS